MGNINDRNMSQENNNDERSKLWFCVCVVQIVLTMNLYRYLWAEIFIEKEASQKWFGESNTELIRKTLSVITMCCVGRARIGS